MVPRESLPNDKIFHDGDLRISNCHTVWLLIAFSLPGCVARGNVDLLETRIRHHEDRLVEFESQLAATRRQLEVARNEAAVLRSQLTDRGAAAILPEQASVLFQATGIKFNSLLTGGLDRDGSAGDEMLSVILTPHDADGDMLKLPGAIELEVLDLSKAEGSQRLGTWNFDAAQSRDYWHSGLVGSGYLFQLPWQQTPESSELLLHARFTTTDGRQFDTSTQIQIEPPNLMDRPATARTSDSTAFQADNQVTPAAVESPIIEPGKFREQIEPARPVKPLRLLPLE